MVIVKELPTKFQVQFSAKRIHPLQDPLGLQREISIIIKADLHARNLLQKNKFYLSV